MGYCSDLYGELCPGEFSWWVTAFANIVAVLPLIGAVKYLDDIAAWGKNLWKGFTKNLDTFVDVYKHSDGFLDGIGAGLKAVWRNQDEVTKLLEETLEAGQKRLDDLKELADSGEDLLGDLGKSGKYWDDVVEGSSDVLKFNNWDDMKDAYKGTIPQFVKENKPKYSPDIRKWFDNGGSIEIQNIDGKQIWTYTSSADDSVPYIDGYIKFPDEYLNPTIKSVDIGEFSGDRGKDIDKMLLILA